MAEIKKIRNNPFVFNGIVATKQKDFDQKYKSIKIIDKIVKTGEGEEDYFIDKKVIEEFTPIQDVIDQDKDNVGVENIIKQVLRTGDTSLLPRDDGKCNVDLVGAPESLMELKQMGVDVEKAYKGLPEELTKGMDMKSFVDSMTQEQFNAFINAVVDRQNKKEEVKANE